MDGNRQLAEVYYKLLMRIDWSDDLLVAVVREGLNKFLSNAFLYLLRGGHKYHRTHFVSRAALEKLNQKNYTSLVFEHLVPKQIYIQQPCEERAASGELTIDFIEDLLCRYWRIATITRDEDARLHRTKMPENWDCNDVTARYAFAGIELVENPFCPTR